MKWFVAIFVKEKNNVADIFGPSEGEEENSDNDPVVLVWFSGVWDKERYVTPVNEDIKLCPTDVRINELARCVTKPLAPKREFRRAGEAGERQNSRMNGISKKDKTKTQMGLRERERERVNENATRGFGSIALGALVYRRSLYKSVACTKSLLCTRAQSPNLCTS